MSTTHDPWQGNEQLRRAAVTAVARSTGPAAAVPAFESLAVLDAAAPVMVRLARLAMAARKRADQAEAAYADARSSLAMALPDLEIGTADPQTLMGTLATEVISLRAALESAGVTR